MRLKEEVTELLQQGRETELAERVSGDRRVVRPLLARLWDPSEEIRSRAARALGHAAAVHPELGREVVRRLMWALNDESTTNGVHAIPALGEIGRRTPDLLAPFVPALATAAKDDGLRLAALEALARLAERSGDAVMPHLAWIESSVDVSRPAERTAWRRLRAALKGDDCHGSR